MLTAKAVAKEVSAVAVMLASDESGYLTGTEINIDGGILAGSAGAATQ
ncbi:MAG: SDR family oxidoreductase [Alkalimonas sp.]|nr:SDR family oxidoreductase [Alkalimonas sp.]